MAEYKVEVLDLTEPADRRQVIPRARAVANVDVVAFEEGTELRIHFGEGDGIPVASTGQSFVICPAEVAGVSVSHGAQPGVAVTLLIGYVGGVRQQ